MHMTEPQEHWLLSITRLFDAIWQERRIVVGVPAAIGVLAAGAIILMPESFRAKAEFSVVSTGGKGGIEGISKLLGGAVGDLLGGSLGSEESSVERLGAILGSRALGLEMIQRHRLDTVWELKADTRWEDRLKRWERCFEWEETSSGNLLLSFEDESPQRAVAVLEGAIQALDSAFRAQQQAQTANTYRYISARLESRRTLMDSAIEALAAFQKSSGMVAPEEQLKQSIEFGARLQGQLEATEIQIQSRSSLLGANHSELKGLEIQRQALSSRLKNLLQGSSPSGRVVKGVRSTVDSGVKFQRLLRDVAVHEAVYRYLLQESERLSLELARDQPVLLVVDPVREPQKRASPPRRVLFQIVVSLVMAVAIGFALFRRMLLPSLPAEEREQFLSLLPTWVARILR